MSKVFYRQCDICGFDTADKTREHRYYSVKIRRRFFTWDGIFTKKYDVCEDCMDKMAEIIIEKPELI